MGNFKLISRELISYIILLAVFVLYLLSVHNLCEAHH